MFRLRLLMSICCVGSLLQAGDASEKTSDVDLTQEETAITALRGIPSNLQKNRDGTVRFLRFSKSIVTNEHLLQIGEFTKLDYLAVVTPTVDDAGFAVLPQLTNLDTLLLSDSSFTSASLPHLTKLPRLERLYLDRTKLDDASLQSLSRLDALQVLSLVETKVGDSGIAHLKPLQNLETLLLDQTLVTEASLAIIGQFPKLKSLSLVNTKVTGAGLSQLAGCQELATLDLTGCELDASVIAQVSLPSKLTDVILRETNLSEADIADWKKTLPKTRFVVSPQPDEALTALQEFQQRERTDSTVPIKDSENTTSAVQTELIAAARERFLNTDATPDFQQHVLPLLGRLGCNGRSCHGSFQGKGGFRLSMFGYDFAADMEALTDRIDLDDPAASYLLQKPTLQEAHEGGKRFEQNGWEHQVLLNWIAGGAKGVERPQKLVVYEVTPSEIAFKNIGETVQLRAVAIWEDGTREDVTCLSRFQTNDETIATIDKDGLVTCRSPGDTYVISFYDNGVASSEVLLPLSDLTGPRYPAVPTPTSIDELVVRKLSRLGIVSAELCTDEEFLRRVNLDLVGSLPTPAEIETFLADSRTDKRQRKIDELLDTPAYLDWWTVILADLTGSNSQYLGTTDMNTPAAEQWHAWLRKRLEENAGWDEIAAGIILAESRSPGETYEQYTSRQSRMWSNLHPDDFSDADNPMHYYWFRSNNNTPEERALSFGYVFLGVRLQCAQCHKHPFDQWSQQDFQKFTQFFSRINRGIAPDARDDQKQMMTKLGVPVQLDTAALRRQMYLRVSAEGLPIPWNEIWIAPPAAKPQIAKLLGSNELDLNAFRDPREPLMEWLVSKENRYFAAAMVNRVWAHYFGVGIVDPPDDFNLANPPSNKPLLNWLSKEFTAHDYDLRWLHRTILSSRTYQQSWRTNETNKTDERNFSHALLRRLPAEVTIDAILQATANEKRNATWKTDTAQRKIGQHPRSIQSRGIDYSLLVFGKPLRTTNCDCERQMQPTLLQSLYVRNDHEMIGWIERTDSWLLEMAAQLQESLVSDVKKDQPLALPKLPKTSTPVPATDIEKLIRIAYLRTLSRHPTETELERSTQHLSDSETRSEGLRDLLWVLLNTQEFLSNH